MWGLLPKGKVAVENLNYKEIVKLIHQPFFNLPTMI
tara:strand:+ start:160 stop:267 length:108 start_codon:yes stop_codon:yes gene_type:complete